MEQATRLQHQATRVPPVAFDFAAFSGAQVAAMTGVTIMEQAQMRRRHFLHHAGWRAKFDVFGVAYVLAFGLLAQRAGPTKSAPVAKFAAMGIGWHALGFLDSYDRAGDHMRALMWDADLAPQLEAFHAATALIRENNDWVEDVARAEAARVAGSLDPGAAGWTTQARWLADESLRQRKGFVTVKTLLVWWADGSCAFQDSVDGAFHDAARDDPRVLGPVVTLDLERLGMLLLTRMKQITSGQGVFVNVRIGK